MTLPNVSADTTQKASGTVKSRSPSKKIIVSGLIVLFGIIFLISAAGYLIYLALQDHESDDDSEQEVITATSESLQTFESDEDFDSYAQGAFEVLEEESGESWLGGLGLGDVMVQEAAPTPVDMAVQSTDGDSETITNIQEYGVDEGDIVKAYKDYLIILRRGRIFSIKIEDQENRALSPISHTNAYPENFTQGTWYDEMLIYNDKLIVIGYSYDLSATEIGLFALNDAGEISHEATYFVDSNDYYSSRNYASRLVDNELIFYMPYYMFDWEYYGDDYERAISLPKLSQWVQDDEVTDGTSILAKTDIYQPVQDTYSPTLHTVVKCDLDQIEFSCSAKAVLGPYSRNFYVTGNAVYLWVSEDNYSWYEEDYDSTPEAYVYMMTFEDDLAKALRALGSPIDQFSFKEDEGYLNVLVRSDSSGDEMWDPESTSGGLALLRTSLDNFSSEPQAAEVSDYIPLPAPEGYTLQNRFVGDYLLYGTGSGWYYDETSEEYLYIVPYAVSSSSDEAEIQRIRLTHSIDRIDIIGDAALVVGTYEEDLQFSSIELSSTANVVDTYTIESATQGELRSHGFSYKALEDGTGVLGLPVRVSGESYENLWEDSSSVLFLKVDAQQQFMELGSFEATAPEGENDNCEYSCVDWYGNSRPIFYSGRIFGLLGYELVEGEIQVDSLTETGRVDFTPE